ncbi:dystroglycan (Dystrophin-associated glycoprotein 1) domain-containing protein [Ditylenchus destructor]|nr:dystroglycan (Dystrophin-associated glycoprotein 1) domain-containing protein [Ditylenchus destructor]
MISSTEEPELAEEVFPMDELLTADQQNLPKISPHFMRQSNSSQNSEAKSQPEYQNQNSTPVRYSKRSPMSRKDSVSARPKIGIMPISASSCPVLSMWFLSTMGLLLLACFANGLEQMVALSGEAPVGALYRGHVFIKSEDVELFNASLPNWFQMSLAPAEADYDTSDPRYGHEKFRLAGIPQLKDVGRHVLILSGEGKTHEIQVTEDTTNDCGEVGTAWIEILDRRTLTDVSVNEQITTVQKLLQTLTNTIGESSMENSLSDFRIFPLKYVNRYRTVSTTFSDEFGDENGNNGLFSPDQMLIALNISCGELNNEYPNEVISVVSDNSAIFKVVGGNLNQNRPPPLDTTTTVPVTRTTRQVHYRPVDNKPMAINRLSTFTCKKGLLCQLSIADNTFLDPEDGNTRRLSLSVDSIGDEQQRNFLMAVPQSTQLEGVPLEAGTFTFRLNARDRANQTASSPFQVIVEEIGNAYDKALPNHQYSMILEGALHKFTSKPEMLRDFTYRLTDSLYGRPASTAKASAGRTPNYQQYAFQPPNSALSVRIIEVVENGETQTMLRWANASLSRKVCQQKQINETLRQMVGGKMDRVRHDFRRLMGAQFHVKKVTLEFLGQCLNPSTPFFIGTIRATTTEVSVDSEPAPTLAQTLLIPLILLAFLLLFIMLLILLCYIQRKGAKHKKKTKPSSDYISKGLPVVFPEEVPGHDDEDAREQAATATTPMLLGKEQPPVQLPPPGQRLTLHENPLYKPPPTTQASLVSPRGPPAITNNATSTFTSPLGARGGSTSSVAPKQGAIAALGQRLPPPYVAAI